MRGWLLPLVLAVLGGLPKEAQGAFFASEADWAGWSDLCKARFVAAADGRETEFASRVTTATVESFEARLGPAWYALHHYCFGVAHLARSKTEQNPLKRAFELKTSIGELNFDLSRTPAEHLMYAEIITQIGLAKLEQNDRVGALESFDQAIASRPEQGSAYQGKALLYWRQGKFPEAREVLVEGNAATGGRSAELHYFLGLVLVDLKNYPEARVSAVRAYALGYPLPGLREKLARAGYPLP